MPFRRAQSQGSPSLQRLKPNQQLQPTTFGTGMHGAWPNKLGNYFFEQPQLAQLKASLLWAMTSSSLISFSCAL